MKIETKYSIGEKVWFIFDNKVQNSCIKCIQINVREGDNRNEPFVVTDFDYVLLAKTRKGEHENHYFEDCELFKTKEELLNSL